MPTLVAVLACIALVAVGELVRFGVARGLRLPTARFAKLFLVVRGGSRSNRVLATFAGSIATYLGVVAMAFALYTCAGFPTRELECTVESVVDGYPAAGKLERGDRIVAIDGKPMFASPSLLIDQQSGAAVRLTVVRHGDTRDVTIQPIGHDGHWILGFRPSLARVRTYDVVRALETALDYPIEQAGQLMPALRGKEEPEPGGPKRIYDEYRLTPPGAGFIALARALQFGVYILLLGLAIDIGRVLRAVTRPGIAS